MLLVLWQVIVYILRGGPRCSECKYRRLGSSKSMTMEDREASGSAHMVLEATVDA